MLRKMSLLVIFAALVIGGLTLGCNNDKSSTDDQMKLLLLAPSGSSDRVLLEIPAGVAQ